jgi:hypothetical protein
VRSQRLIRKRVEFSGAGVTLDSSIELLGIERLEPGAEARKLGGSKFLYGLLDIFGGCHNGTIAFAVSREKAIISRLRWPGGLSGCPA